MGFGLDSDAIHSPMNISESLITLKELKLFRCFTNILLS
jgi:hypothetical protein